MAVVAFENESLSKVNVRRIDFRLLMSRGDITYKKSGHEEVQKYKEYLTTP